MLTEKFVQRQAMEMAERELADLRKQIDELESLRVRAYILETFLERAKGANPMGSKQPSQTSPSPRFLFGREISPEETLELQQRIEHAEDILRKEAQPMKVAAIFKKFEENQWTIGGKNPKENLRQTLLGRKDKFRKLEGGDFELI